MAKANEQKQCISCSICDSGFGLKVKQACTQTSDTICEPLEGFKLCKPGQYISKTGTSSSDTECSDCSTGTFSDGSVTSCQPHTRCETLKLQLIKAGTASADAECGEKSFTGIVTGVVVAAAAVLTGLAVTTILYIKKKRKKPDVLNCFKNKPNKDYSIEHENTSIREEEEEGRRHVFIRRCMLMKKKKKKKTRRRRRRI
ncbi:tumor necrosis factor receptor superfamily member 14, partial [Nematolebias whitei]|uniref:tumor necrosis factor receptor superfamily member 14 n=1 Tax=Nematolebias whitei TaxID=451745 RepID=UPI00189B3C45